MRYKCIEGKKRRKKVRVNCIAAFAMLVFAMTGLAGCGERYEEDDEEIIEPNMEEISFFDYIGNRLLDRNTFNVVAGGEILVGARPPRIIDDQLHLSAEFLRAHVDEHIFWENNTGRLTISTVDEISRFYPDQYSYTVNWQPQELATPIRQIGDMAYISVEMVMNLYDVDIRHSDDYNFVVLDFNFNGRAYYEIVMPQSGDDEGGGGNGRSGQGSQGNQDNQDNQDRLHFVPMRFGPNDQYPIMARLNEGDVLISHNANLQQGQESHYIRLQKENGLIGYVLADNIRQIAVTPHNPPLSQYRPITRDLGRPINLAYHLIGINNPDSWYAPPGVNVLAPMWFTFNEEARNGDIVSLARHDYVAWANSHDIEVWPAITDMFFGGNFSNEVSRLVLLDANIRDHVIAQLMQFIQTYNLGGINIDYEMVFEAESEHWIQFLRELSVPMADAGAVLSVAVKPPAPHNMFWNRTQIALAADFLIIMAYDEHWATIDTAGPVASFGFVQNAVLDTLNEARAEQIVVALPTYVRIWREEFTANGWELIGNNVGGQATRAVGMQYARNFIIERGGSFYWDYITRQYYGHVVFDDDGVDARYRVWLEDLRSMDEKLSVFVDNGLAGVGFWQKGLELPDMWALVDERLGN